jgi:hypothetical protein
MDGKPLAVPVWVEEAPVSTFCHIQRQLGVWLLIGSIWISPVLDDASRAPITARN